MARRQAIEEPSSGHLIREAEAITGGVLALFLVLAFVSYYPDSPRSNLGGALGHNLAGGALQALGFPAYLLPIYLGYLTFALLRRDTSDLGGMRLAGAGVFVTALSSMGGLFADGKPLIRGGGWFGGFLGTALRDLFGGPGAFLVLAALLTVSLMMATGRSAFAVAQQGMALLREHGGEWLVDARDRWASWRAGRVEDPEPRARKPRRAKSGEAIVLDEVVDDEKPARPKPQPPVRADGAPPIYREPERRAELPKKPVARRFEGQEELFGPDTYKLPPLSLLDNAVRTVEPPDENTLLASARILETKLADFGVAGKVVAVRPGPVITTFEFEPAPGVKVARIVGLGEDLMMAMRAASVRVVAPIPGKPVVGVEVSNPRREKVFIKELLQSDEYRAAESKMTMALGKDTTGNPQVADLSRMPHLLIAGATGTGKSVSMNAMLMSILFKASPRDVRLIMIDPKMLELSIYEHIPHLLVPVVTDPKKASAALHNMIREMENRYRMLHDKGVRSLDSYNNLIAEGTAAAKKAREDERAEAQAQSPGEIEDDAPPFDVINLGKTKGETPLEHRHLPRIIVIVDELADLMMTVGHEVEESITRLAQKARAAGIHLILATQRPSVDVITGLIKANFPARISFQTRSRPDSRTILDSIGAERLLGDGDMLFLSPTNSRLQRLHGPFVSDEDVHRVVDFIKKQEQPHYEMAFLEGGDEEEGGDGEFEEDMTDEMYDQGVHLVTKYRQASISWLQRKLRVGYNRAARMIERMEREGIVSAPSGPKGREVIAQAIPDDDEMIVE